MVLASSLVSPVFMALLWLSQHPEQNNGGGLPLALVPVIILIVLLLIFLSSYFTSTGIQGKAAVETAVPHNSHDSHDDHHAEPALVVPDDLKIVEGIGPKIEGILHEAGIKTFAQLAAASVNQLEQIVREDAGIRIAFPDTWPEQARLAAAGNWDALETLQEELKGGRRE